VARSLLTVRAYRQPVSRVGRSSRDRLENDLIVGDGLSGAVDESDGELVVRAGVAADDNRSLGARHVHIAPLLKSAEDDLEVLAAGNQVVGPPASRAFVLVGLSFEDARPPARI
jgi:hypothetical protein